MSTLIEQASDTDNLIEFFSAYRELRRVLVKKGEAYRALAKIDVRKLDPPVALICERLPRGRLLAFCTEE